MGKYVFGFKGGGMPEGEEEAKRVMDEWMAWYGGMFVLLSDADYRPRHGNSHGNIW